MTITEYHEIDIPDGDSPQAIRQAFIELHAHLIRISERLNDLEAVIINWKKIQPSSITLSAGTPIGDINDLRTAADGNFYSVTEAAATPGSDLVVDFNDIVEFRLVQIIAIYNGAATHGHAVQLYNRATKTWDTFADLQNSQEDVTNAGGYILNNVTFFVPDVTNYIGNGNVKVRIYHTMGGNAAHDLYIDVVALYR